jgi:hypothetical protein
VKFFNRRPCGLLEVAEASAEPSLADNRKIGKEDTENSVLQDREGKEGKAVEPANSNSSEVERGQDREEEKPSKLNEIWGKIPLDMRTVMIILKGLLHLQSQLLSTRPVL